MPIHTLAAHRSQARRGAFAVALAFVGLGAGGCVNLGASRVGLDRSLYTERLRQSEEEQLLANIVAMREGRAPFFLTVSSVINQFTREASGNLGVNISPPTGTQDGSLGGGVVLRETPTVTYTPVAGEAFAQIMLSPLPPVSLLSMMEAGWAADDLLRLTARSINGVRGVSRSPMFEQTGGPTLNQVIDAFRRLQRSGAISISVAKSETGFRARANIPDDLSQQDREDLAFLARALKVEFDGKGGEIVLGAAPESPRQIAIATRTMLEVLAELGQGVDLDGSGQVPTDALIRVHSGAKAPDRAFCSVQMNGRWYWIAGEDTVSIRRFLLTQILLSLTSQVGGSRGPLVTVPLG